MTRIGLLSDTHGYLDPAVFTYFERCDELWHAGDVGAADVAEQLRAFRPLRVVRGNIDPLRSDWPDRLRFSLDGVDVWIEHICGKPPRYVPALRSELRLNPPAILVCGHSHILTVQRDPALRGMLFLNPGAAGRSGFHKVRTCLRFSLDAGRVFAMEAIELGTR